MSPIKVEVSQYREMNKGSLKAFFSLVIYPEGQKILDCRYFVQGDKRWFNFPQKEIKYTDGRQTDYIPYVSYLNKQYLEQLKASVLAVLLDVKPEGNNGKKNRESENQENSVSPQAQVSWGQQPF